MLEEVMPEPDPIAYLARLNPDHQGLFLAIMAVVGGLIHQRAVNREKLIDYLLEATADLDQTERQGPYAGAMAAMVQILEGTQFPRRG
jgi:hypothetical protein